MRRCTNCTLPLAPSSAAKSTKSRSSSRLCERCSKEAKPSLAFARGVRREDASSLLRAYYVKERIRPPL